MPLKLGAMKQARDMCSTFKAFNLTYLHVLRAAVRINCSLVTPVQRQVQSDGISDCIIVVVCLDFQLHTLLENELGTFALV